MSGIRVAATKGLHLGLAAIRHTGWWLHWQAGGRADREVTELAPLPRRTAAAEPPAA
jgi:hypothetical protein